MNEVYLKGCVRDVTASHTLQGADYDKAVVVTEQGEQFPIKCKHSATDNLEEPVSLYGQLRSYSNGSKTEVYIYTDFARQDDSDNFACITGNICSKGELCKGAKKCIVFVVANNIYIKGLKINSYIPCVAFGEVAESIAQNYSVSDKIYVAGQMHIHNGRCEIVVGDICHCSDGCNV